MLPIGPRPIALIGPMGSGKTETAKRLATLLGWQFVDIDELVVRNSGKPIERIFREDGEEEFRRLESQALVLGLTMTPAVLACGGGVVAEPDNIKLLKSSATVVYLKVDAKVAVARVGNDPDRPLAQSLPQLLAEREHLYAQTADLVVDADKTVEEVAGRIRSLIGAT